MRVVQCWDDGNVDDLRLMDLLRRHGATATFNLNPGLHRAERCFSWRYADRHDVWKLASGELREAYRGFSIANHTVNHLWPTKITDAELRTEIVDGRGQLEAIFDRPIRGFAYPFGDYDARVMEAVRAAGHCYARTVAYAKGPAFPPADPMAFHPTCHQAAPEFWELFERAKAVGGLFYFWGHSYEFVDEAAWQAIDTKLARLAADPAVEWAELESLFQA